MEILDLVGSEAEGNASLDNKTDFMNLRRIQPRVGLRDRLLTVQADHAAIDNLIRGLVDLLPKPDGVWPLDDRAKWLRLAAGIFDLGYKEGDDEHRQISIALVKPEVTNA